jgi:hypothetical protein
MAFGSALAYLAFWRIVTLLPLSGIATIAITTLLYLFLAILFTVRMSRALYSPKAIMVNLLLSGILYLPITLRMIASSSSSVVPGLGVILPLYVRLFRIFPGLDGLLLVWFAASLGIGISRLVREVKMLLPISVILALVDLYVVFGGGLVTQAVSGKSPTAEKMMSALTVRLPTQNLRGGATPIPLAIGMADFLFIAMFFACFFQFQIPVRRTFQILYITLSTYMLIVFFSGISLPALVPIAIVVIGMNLKRFRYERSELFALLYAGLICSVVAGVLFFMSRHK